MKRIKLKDRILPTYTRGEEIFNMVSHIVGAILGIVAIILGVIFSAINKNRLWNCNKYSLWNNTISIIYNV